MGLACWRAWCAKVREKEVCHLSMQLEGRVAAVTGGTAGIGRGIAEAFLEEGARVGLMARGQEKAERVLGELGAGDRVVFVPGTPPCRRMWRASSTIWPSISANWTFWSTTPVAPATCSR